MANSVGESVCEESKVVTVSSRAGCVLCVVFRVRVCMILAGGVDVCVRSWSMSVPLLASRQPHPLSLSPPPTHPCTSVAVSANAFGEDGGVRCW
jgi:hypothetical protein